MIAGSDALLRRFIEPCLIKVKCRSATLFATLFSASKQDLWPRQGRYLLPIHLRRSKAASRKSSGLAATVEAAAAAAAAEAATAEAVVAAAAALGPLAT
jgi:hypothetical protein